MKGEMYNLTDGSLALKGPSITDGPWGDLCSKDDVLSELQGKGNDNMVRALDFLNRLASNYRARSSQEESLTTRLEAPIVVSVKLTKDTERSEQDLVERTRRSIDRAYSQWKSDRLLQKLYPGVGEGKAYMRNGNVVYKVLGREEPVKVEEIKPADAASKEASVKRALKKISYM